VRQEARAAQLAYGFLRGIPYKSIEAKCWTPPSWDRVGTLAARYGALPKTGVLEALVTWRGDKGWPSDKTIEELRACSSIPEHPALTRSVVGEGPTMPTIARVAQRRSALALTGWGGRWLKSILARHLFC
jgi:hypothetical protein